MAELDKPTDENKIKNRSQNVYFFPVEYLTSRLMVWHLICSKTLLIIVNIIFTDGIRMFPDR